MKNPFQINGWGFTIKGSYEKPLIILEHLSPWYLL